MGAQVYVCFSSDAKEKDVVIIIKYDNAKRTWNNGIFRWLKASRGKVKLDGNYLTEKYAGKDVRIKKWHQFCRCGIIIYA
jgi:hypothetical protein